MRAWGISDIGCVRSQNQDTYHLSMDEEKKLTLAVVCDGMGGARAGNVASETAVATFVDAFKEGSKAQMTAKQLEKLMSGALELANSAVYEKARSGPEYRGMGTTLVACAVSGNTAVLLNVGDSRAYLINASGIEQISRDHSFVEDLVARGQITKEQARNHPNKNLITRAVGTFERVNGDMFAMKLKKGDHVLLCSDGVSNLIDDQELLYEIIHSEEKEECCHRILEIVKERGAPDNATVVVIEK